VRGSESETAGGIIILKWRIFSGYCWNGSQKEQSRCEWNVCEDKPKPNSRTRNVRLKFPTSEINGQEEKVYYTEWWIGKDLEGSCHSLIQDPIPEFVWRVWGKPRKISFRITRFESLTSLQRNTSDNARGHDVP
jgi:hypothetical protein